jgi:hypothetical protein
MLKALPFPLLYVAEVAVWVLLLASFVALWSFLGATPMGDLDLHGKRLPSTWEAAVSNHGTYLPGYMIANHPVAFSIGVFGLLFSAAMLYVIHRAQKQQRLVVGADFERVHKVANLSVMAALAAISYILIFHLLVGVHPA